MFFFLQPNQDFWISKEKPNGSHGTIRKVLAPMKPKPNTLKSSLNLWTQLALKTNSNGAILNILKPIHYTYLLLIVITNYFEIIIFSYESHRHYELR